MSALQDAFNYFTGQGYSPYAAAGISSGLFAESSLSATAVNPSSGAFGIGQWLGARKASLIGTYGPNPTFSQQLDFVNSELQSGNGGSTIAASGSAGDALNSFINLFERPGPGAAGDIARGTRALGQLDMSGTASGVTGSTGGGSFLDDISGTVEGIISTIGGGSPGDFAAGLNILSGNATNAQGQTVYQAAGSGIGAQIQTALDNIGKQLAPILFRSGFGVIGVILIVIGLVAIVASNKQVQQVAAAAVA